ncbi:MAG: cation transporter [Bacteroidetes bacterium]|uniref:Cation transporter n=1 Tax=Candidatus Cryptobacteroides excrementipullorum TaxID=2840761 RepID=A0A9D9IUW0_9BACT|nr:cation transporter [Candidatus Cryptobacteroides excrementipullorum]
MSVGIPVEEREKRITRVTLLGSVVNLVLSVGKVLAGVFGHSAAMIADGIHSISDLASDIVVLVFVRISSKGEDRDHEYGHGKFETLATLIMSLILIVVAAQLMASGIRTIAGVLSGEAIPSPKYIALVAAVVSIVSKEWLYRYTVKAGNKLDSPVVVANAWHHRSDALSSVGSLVGIAGAMFLGSKWTMLDPLASCCISIAIFVVAVKMAVPSLKELLDVSLPQDMEQKIIAVSSAVPGVMNVHGLKTRRNGPSIIIEAHIVVDPSITVVQAHNIATAVEDALKHSFGNETQISLHIEPGVNAR